MQFWKKIFLKIIMGDPIEKFRKKNFFLKIIMGDPFDKLRKKFFFKNHNGGPY